MDLMDLQEHAARLVEKLIIIMGCPRIDGYDKRDMIIAVRDTLQDVWNESSEYRRAWSEHHTTDRSREARD